LAQAKQLLIILVLLIFNSHNGMHFFYFL